MIRELCNRHWRSGAARLGGQELGKLTLVLLHFRYGIQDTIKGCPIVIVLCITFVMAILLALFSVVLLVYCTGVCASQESDLVVLTTASGLREEIKSQLDETLAQSLPDFTCN